MLDKSLLLRQMRKHAQTFSSAVKPVKEPDDVAVNRALSLIEMAEKDSKLVAFRKMSFKTPSLLKGMFLQDNLTDLRSEIEKRLPENCHDCSAARQGAFRMTGLSWLLVAQADVIQQGTPLKARGRLPSHCPHGLYSCRA